MAALMFGLAFVIPPVVIAVSAAALGIGSIPRGSEEPTRLQEHRA